MKMKTAEQLRDIAYGIGVENTLIESLSYDELQKISDEDLTALAWEPFEFFSADDLHCNINQIADSIIDAFKP